jgi:hypothetical protein
LENLLRRLKSLSTRPSVPMPSWLITMKGSGIHRSKGLKSLKRLRGLVNNSFAVLWLNFRDYPSTWRLIMVSKIISLLIALNACTLLAHDNFNQISANVDSSALDSSNLKLNHQSYFYIPNGDAFILDLTHRIHHKHFQNDLGLAYRTFLRNAGIGVNFYYQHSNRLKAFLHQFSPGLELLYKNLQVSYNLYLPTSVKMDLERGSIFHSRTSELGIKWFPRKDFNVGILPFYDHTQSKWGLNSKISYILKERLEFGLSPYWTSENKGCTFSFGVNFGPTKGIKSTHRSNRFNCLIERCSPKNPKIWVAKPGPILPPELSQSPQNGPTIIHLPGAQEDYEQKTTESAPTPKETGAKSWWDTFPLRTPTAPEPKKEEEKPLALSNTETGDLFFVPPWGQILEPFIKGPDHSGSYV